MGTEINNKDNRNSEIVLKKLFKKIMDDFDPGKERPNKKYLESQLIFLNGMVYTFRNNSTDPNFSPRNRARARDMEQNCLGLINGIKFAIAFMEYGSEIIS